MPLKTFISYCHADERDLQDLQECLKPLRQEGILKVWSDGEIVPGSDWNAEILERLDDADLVLLLLSRPYLASDFCILESQLARKRQRAGQARVIPILMRDCDWNGFRDLQFLLGTKPVPENGEKRDKAFRDISRKLRKLAVDLQREKNQRHPRPVIGEPDLRPEIPRADAETLNDQALKLVDRGELQFARWTLERAIEVHRSFEGEDSEEFAVLLSNHGLILQGIGELHGAQADLKRALAIFEERYGRRHPVFASHLADLGGVLLDLGETQESCSLLKEAIGVLESSPDAAKAVVVRARIHLAGALGAQGQTMKAEEILNGILAEEPLESEAAAAAISARGRLARQEGRLRAALGYFRRAVEIGKKVLGEKHPDVAIDLNNLGLVLRDLGKEREAGIVLRRAQDLFAEKLGEGSPRLAWAQIEAEELEARGA